MNRRTRMLLGGCLLVLVGIWMLFSRPGTKSSAPGSNAGSTTAQNPASNSTGAVATASAPAKYPTLNTNRLAYRLSNTTNSIRQLESEPHVILLANAFIDTEQPLNLNIPANLRSLGDPGAYIVQARSPIDAAFRALLASAGAKIVSYIPNNAYLVNVSAGVAGRLSANPLVQVVLPYEPYYKIQSTLLGVAVEQQKLPPGTALTLGGFSADADQVEAEVQKLGAKVIGHDRSPFGPVLRVLPPDNWTTLAQSPMVQFVEPSHQRVTANDLSRVTMGISPDTTSPIASGYAVNGAVLTGDKVLVQVNDSGVDMNHPDFSVGGTAQNPMTVPPSRVTGLNFLDTVDTNGHGTFVAGIIAGNGSAILTVSNVPEGSVLGADFRGKAPSANLFSMNLGSYSDFQLQTNAATVGALISNNSWDFGKGATEYDLAAASYDDATRDARPFSTGAQPVLFVFAAGNDGGGNNDGSGGNGDTILSPGTAKNVITVGALEQFRNITNVVTTITFTGTNGAPVTNKSAYWQPQTDTSDQVAFYSARGNTGIQTEGPNGRFKPDLVVPGTFVVSTSSQFNNEWDTNAYYNPTNLQVTTYTAQVVSSNSPVYYNVPVPPNAVGVTIAITPNRFSPSPFPTNITIYCQQSGFPDPVNAPGSIDLTTMTNGVIIPPGGGNCVFPNLDGNGFDFEVAVNNGQTVNYDVTVSVQLTNNVGDLYSVLEGMNDSIGGYYRYESGTSMAAAGVSGLLALIQDYFTNDFKPAIIPSPALMKAVLINGCRSVGNYGLAFTNGNNFQGWGQGNIQSSVPANGLFNQADGTTLGSSFFVDQSPAKALATGDSHTYIINLNTNGTFATFYNLQATVVWTDPPGDPAAAIKLVNNLDLIITNLDTGDVFFGNDISPDVGFNLPWDTNGVPNLDSINNVENVLLQAPLAGRYSVTVLGRSVNVNAVTQQTNDVTGKYLPNIVQDYALVISVGQGEEPAAFSVTDNGITMNPTGDQNFTIVTSTNAPLMNQMVGASSPLMGTNTLPLGNKTVWGPNGLVTIGQTNQWHFYVVTNTGIQPDFTNAAFLTFGVNTLSIPRMGVYADTVANATKPEANIDMFVTDDPSLVNLNPVAISNCLAGVGNSRASVLNGGTQFVYYTNSVPGQSVYYIGIQAEDQNASEYDFLPVFTDIPFGSLDQNGNQIVNGLMLPMPIPTGNNAHPGLTNIFALAIMPMEVENVTVTNFIQHQNFGDLFGVLSFSGEKVVLHNHDGFGNTFNNNLGLNVYNDMPKDDRPLGTTNSDGPGSLLNYRAKSALGPWILSELDNSAGGFTGQVERFTLLIQPHRDLKQPGVIVSVPPGGWFIDWVDVPAGYTNLTFYATNVTPAGQLSPLAQEIQMYERFGNDPTLTAFDQRADLVNGNPPGNTISVGPPLPLGRYFIGLFNPNVNAAQNVFLSATLGIDRSVNDIFNYNSSNSMPLLDDAVSSSIISVPNTVTQLVASVNVGLVINSPRISDYTFTLVSPTGQRILLMENRGGGDTNGAGLAFVYTNVINSTATGGAAANTNYLAVNPLGSSIPITWNFYTVPDQMTVYDTTNPALFNPNGPDLLYNTGFASNAPAGPGGAQNTIPFTTNVIVAPGVSNITIIMNQFGNPFASGGDAWIYTAGAPVTNYEYLEFTEDTNLANVPIKFAAPPFNFASLATNFTLSDLDLATNGNYLGQTNIDDTFNGGWLVPSNITAVVTIETNGQFVLVTNTLILTNNLVSVVTDPSTALGGDSGASNYLALANGTITRTIPTVVGRQYNVTFWYRGPGIVGWWRGEGNGLDSSDPENNNNNGHLIGRFNFPAGEVSQAFGFQDNGNTYQFAGTNTYVQIPASPSLDVGHGGGFTVEGWIAPTNLTRPQPLVEWLAHVPTNTVTSDTNLTIVQGPVYDQATGHYYYLLGSTNWFVSEIWAKQLGGDLVTLESANEDQWVYDTFTAYGTLNRDLWTGLNDFPILGTYHWASGATNVAFTDWAPGEPAAACTSDRFVAIMGPTNAYPTLWNLLSSNGELCNNPPTNPVYGVVEVPDIPTNGVQFWISGTNWTGSSNALQGCLYANIVDTNYVSHPIWSAPGLLTTDVFQHVALTFDTNSGIAALYLNGTNVATSNLFVGGISFVPKTDGDVLLGWDMSRYTNNFYGGSLDELSIYSRAMSLAEISAIYHVSADTTNRLTGKFDPRISPAVGLSEAVVAFDSVTNVIYGVNNRWSVNSYTFTATTNSMPLTITGVEPGMLLDAFGVQEAPLTNLYYLPEQDLSALNGTVAGGSWTLQIWDNRAGAFLPNVDQLVNWQLSLVLESNAVVAATLPPETPVSTTVPPGQTVYYAVPVPYWAHEATNILVSSTQPLDMFYFAANNPPNNGGAADATALNAPTGVPPGLPILAVVPGVGQLPMQTNTTYYLGLRNNSIHAAQASLEVDFDIQHLPSGAPFSDILTNEYSAVRYFSFDVSSNAYEATFQLLKLTGNADLVLRKGAPLPALNQDDYGSFNSSNADENIYLFTNSTPVPLSAGRWYMGVVNRDGTPVHYGVLAKELDLTNLNLPTSVMPAIINLTNGVPFKWTAGPGADLTNFFRFQVTNNLVGGTNIPVHGLRFELFDASGNGDLTVQTNWLPLAPPFLQSSLNEGTRPELIFVYTNSVLTNLAADWYLGVPNREKTNIAYTIVAEVETNLYFPAFPAAEGVGGGALGGRFGDIYHVITTADSGFGSLRDAIDTAVTNRTVVFDTSGTIFLNTPLVITNSYLTLAGETSPGGGITLEGQMTTVQSAHDVVIRHLRFRVAGVTTAGTNGFDAVAPTNYFPGQTINGWTVVSNQTSVVNDRVTAYGGHSHFLALANGVISNNIATVPGKSYTLSLPYRGPGIVGWWRGENNANSSVDGNNATNVANVAYAAGRVGQAFSFDGVNNSSGSSVITTPASSSLAVSNITIEGWIYPTNTQYEPVVEYGGPGQYGAICLWVNGGGLVPNPGMMYTQIRPSNPTVSSAAGIVPVNAWSHVAMTLDANSGAVSLYCNGVNVVTAYINPASVPVNPPTSQPLNIGWRNTTSQDVFDGYDFGGLLDEISIYNRALSPSELKAIYSDGAAGKFDPAVYGSSPEQSLAEAALVVPGIATNVFFGNNTNWQVQTITFTATGTSTPVLVSGIEPGVLLDTVTPGAGGNLAGTLQFNSVSNVIADHLSLSWSTNNDLSILASTNVTVQWSVMADTILNSAFFNSATDPDDLVQTGGTNAPDIGSVVRQGGGVLSLHHNLYADNAGGSLRLGDNLAVDFVNNVSYNWLLWPIWTGGQNDVDLSPGGSTNQLNLVANYFIAGPDTAIPDSDGQSFTNIAYFGNLTNATAANWIFQTNNFIDGDTNGILNGSPTGLGMISGGFTTASRAFYTIPVTVDEAYKAYEKVLDFAGVNMALRDPADIGIVTGVRSQNGRLIGAVPVVPGLGTQLPYLDTDQDGLPDFWENTFTPALLYVPSNNNDRDGDGYTDVEEYNNWLAVPHALTITNTPVGIDLYQMFGESGRLAFYLTNAIHGQVYLTNVLGAFTNLSASWSNTIAVFTPTNAIGSGTNYYGYASFDVFATNLDTAAFFGPVTVSVIVSATPVATNYNFPPVITPLTSGVLDPTNTGGSLYYSIQVTTNDYGLTYEIDNPSGPMAMVITKDFPYPSLSRYDYYTNLPPSPGNLVIFVGTNSVPKPIAPGTWYMAAVNEAGSNVTYDVKVTLLSFTPPPTFISPTNGQVFTNIETTPFTITCTAVDSNTPPLPLTYGLANGPTNMTIDPVTGVINWTPTEAQGPSTNAIAVSASNGSIVVTNVFSIIVEESNLPPVLPNIPNQVVSIPNTLVVANTATDPDIPANPLTYVLLSAPTNAAIDTNGIITWTPMPAQVGSNYLFTTVVTDTNPWAVNQQSFSVTNSFFVSVQPPVTPYPPLTNVVNPRSIFWYAVDVPPNAIQATNILFFATGPLNLWYSTNQPPSITNSADAELLTNALAGSSVVATNAAPPLQPGSRYYLGVQNTNSFGVTNEVTVNFNLVASPTNFSNFTITYTNIAGTNGFLLTWLGATNDQFHVLWTPKLLPMTWANFRGVVSYSTFISATNSRFQFFDDGSQTGGFDPTRFYRLLLLNSPTNTAPLYIYAPGSLFAPPSVPFTFTNTAVDRDVPAQLLAYAVTNTLAGTNVSVNPLTGVISWTPDPSLLGQTNIITTTVSDNGVPPMSTTNVMLVVVSTNSLVSAPPFSSIALVTNGVKFTWSAPTNEQFRIRWTTNLAPTVVWQVFPGTNTSITGNFFYVDTNTLLLMKFYQLILLP